MSPYIDAVDAHEADDEEARTRNQLTELMVDAYCRRYHESDDPVRDGMEDVLDAVAPSIETALRREIAGNVRVWCDHTLAAEPCDWCQYVARRIEQGGTYELDQA